jgi:type I restriction enzyme, R subunit
MRDNSALKNAKVDAKELAAETEALAGRFPNAQVNPDEQRRLRAALYRPLLKVPSDERARIVDQIAALLIQEPGS